MVREGLRMQLFAKGRKMEKKKGACKIHTIRKTTETQRNGVNRRLKKTREEVIKENSV